jgi:hypothetical protein
MATKKPGSPLETRPQESTRFTVAVPVLRFFEMLKKWWLETELNRRYDSPNLEKKKWRFPSRFDLFS